MSVRPATAIGHDTARVRNVRKYVWTKTGTRITHGYRAPIGREQPTKIPSRPLHVIKQPISSHYLVAPKTSARNERRTFDFPNTIDFRRKRWSEPKNRRLDYTTLRPPRRDKTKTIRPAMLAYDGRVVSAPGSRSWYAYVSKCASRLLRGKKMSVRTSHAISRFLCKSTVLERSFDVTFQKMCVRVANSWKIHVRNGSKNNEPAEKYWHGAPLYCRAFHDKTTVAFWEIV